MVAHNPCLTRSGHFNKWRAIALARRSRYCATAIKNGRVSAAVTPVAPTISLLTWVKCPASMLRDGHYIGSVAAAVTRSRLCSLAFTSWASAARHCGHQLKKRVRACLLLVPKVSSTNKAEQCAAL